LSRTAQERIGLALADRTGGVVNEIKPLERQTYRQAGFAPLRKRIRLDQQQHPASLARPNQIVDHATSDRTARLQSPTRHRVCRRDGPDSSHRSTEVRYFRTVARRTLELS
jgi:hypothetical protein